MVRLNAVAMGTGIELIRCTENAYPPHGTKPVTFREIGAERILGRCVLNWASLGTYGMGGPGFFGLLLEGNKSHCTEWLILSLWGSADWLLLDGKEIAVHVTEGKLPCEPVFAVMSRLLGRFSILLLPVIVFYHMSRRFVRAQWDGVWTKLIGSQIVEVAITEGSSVIKFEKRGAQHVLEAPQPGPHLADGAIHPITANHLDAWVISKSGAIYI